MKSGISRRELIRSSAGTAVVSAVGMAGLLELLANRKAFAVGEVIGLAGITREPDEEDETPHRHTFGAQFQITSISPSKILGNVSGSTAAVISTGTVTEDEHLHLIHVLGVNLESLIDTGAEFGDPEGHKHPMVLG